MVAGVLFVSLEGLGSLGTIADSDYNMPLGGGGTKRRVEVGRKSRIYMTHHGNKRMKANDYFHDMGSKVLVCKQGSASSVNNG